jgi:NAD(P)-dependent dehydrogenase (short-subunit alcohol dehydrogenase family)
MTSTSRVALITGASQGIRSNAVALGIIKTPMHDPSDYDALATLHPIGRVGEVTDVVDSVLYFENAPFVTGEILHVDGGQSGGH